MFYIKVVYNYVIRYVIQLKKKLFELKQYLSNSKN